MAVLIAPSPFKQYLLASAAYVADGYGRITVTDSADQTALLALGCVAESADDRTDPFHAYQAPDSVVRSDYLGRYTATGRDATFMDTQETSPSTFTLVMPRPFKAYQAASGVYRSDRYGRVTVSNSGDQAALVAEGGVTVSGGGAPVVTSPITSLQVMDATLLDQTNDYSDATSRIGVNGNGWVAKVTVPYLVGQTFDPTKISLTVTDPGYDTSASATTVTRTITGVQVLRRQYSANASSQQSNDGITLTVYFSLDDVIYSGSTITAAAAAASFYGSSTAGSVTGPTNASTRTYYKPLLAWHNKQKERATGSTFHVELGVNHRFGMNGQMVACVQFIGKDAQATPNVAATQTVSAPTLSTFQTQGQASEVFAADIPLTALTQADLCTVNAKVYPWIGDSTAVLDLSADGLTWPTANPQTLLQFLNDKTGGYGGAHVAYKSGAVGTAAFSTYAAAVAAPCGNLSTALNALKTYNNTNKGHNDHSGGTLWLMEDSLGAGATIVPPNMNTATAGKCWTDVKADPAATGAVLVNVSATAVTTDLLCWRVNLAHGAVGNGLDAGFAGSLMSAWEGCTIDTTSATVPIWYRNGLIYCRNVTFTGGGQHGLNGYATTRTQVALALGCTGNLGGIQVYPFAMVGCSFTRTILNEVNRASVPTWDDPDGSFFDSNLLLDSRGTSGIGNLNAISRGIALASNVIEGVQNGAIPLLKVGGDAAVVAMANVIMVHNTMIGERINVFYTDVAAAAGVLKGGTRRFNITDITNSKTDVFTGVTTATGRVGNWQVRHGVSQMGECNIRGENTAGWGYEAWDRVGVFNGGLANISFTTNASMTGTNVGGGDYSLTGATNIAYSRVPGASTSRVSINGSAVPLTCRKYDMVGNLRKVDGTGAAGAYERTV